jgi:hypothetical protein
LNFPKIVHRLVYEHGKNCVFAIDVLVAGLCKVMEHCTMLEHHNFVFRK